MAMTMPGTPSGRPRLVRSQNVEAVVATPHPKIARLVSPERRMNGADFVDRLRSACEASNADPQDLKLLLARFLPEYRPAHTEPAPARMTACRPRRPERASQGDTDDRRILQKGRLLDVFLGKMASWRQAGFLPDRARLRRDESLRSVIPRRLYLQRHLQVVPSVVPFLQPGLQEGLLQHR